jgi:hypothetical protein
MNKKGNWNYNESSSVLLTATDEVKNFFDVVKIIDKHHYNKITS